MAQSLKSYKKELDYSYALGAFPTFELLQARPDIVMQVLLSSDLRTSPDILRIREISERRKIGISTQDHLFSRIGAKENCYVVGVFRKYSLTLEPDRSHVVLVDPGNMGNLGTIIRTILGFGIRNLAIIRPGLDIFDPKVIRASMGALFRINFQYFDSFGEYRDICPGHDLYPFMLKASTSLGQVRPDPSRVFSLVFGNEAAGLADEFLDFGTPVVIEHSGQIDSLNLPVALGVAVYDFYNKTNLAPEC